MAKTLIAFFSRADENYFGGAMRYVKTGNEYSCQSGNRSDIIRILFRYYPDANAAGIDTAW